MVNKPTLILINYSTADFMKRAVDSIRYSQKKGSLNIILIDNGSHDSSPEYLRSQVWEDIGDKPTQVERPSIQVSCASKRHKADDYSKLETFLFEKDVAIKELRRGESLVTVHLYENHGYETGVNVGMELANEYFPDGNIVLMGSDVMLFRNTIEELQRSMDLHPKIGIVCAKLLGKVGERYFVRFGGSTNRMGHEHIVGFDMDPGEWHDFKTQEWVTFSMVMLRREMVEQLGGMECCHIKVYAGDNHYCRRARQRGWIPVYAPTARAIHEDGRTVALVKREKTKKEWDEWQRQEMGWFAHYWENEIVPVHELPQDILDLANSWPGR